MTKYEQGVESTKMLTEDSSIHKGKNIAIIIVCTIILMLVIGIILNGIVISTKSYLREENLFEQKIHNEFQQIEDTFDKYILKFEKYTGIAMCIGSQKMNELLDRISRFCNSGKNNRKSEKILDIAGEYRLTNGESYKGYKLVKFVLNQKANQTYISFYAFAADKYKWYQDSFIRIENDKGFHMTRVGYGKNVFLQKIGRNRIKLQYNGRSGYYIKVRN